MTKGPYPLWSPKQRFFAMLPFFEGMQKIQNPVCMEHGPLTGDVASLFCGGDNPSDRQGNRRGG